MVFYICEKCGKEFNQKDNYTKHINKKDKIELSNLKEIEENKNIETLNMTTKHDLGQYFTTNTELKEKIFEFILNDPSNILEPSIGHLLKTKYQI